MSEQAQTPAMVIARGLLDWYGGDPSRWTQGPDTMNADGQPCGCIATADWLARRYVSYPDLNWSQFTAALASVTGWDNFIAWNDAPGRTFAEVEAALKRVAAGEGAAS